MPTIDIINMNHIQRSRILINPTIHGWIDGIDKNRNVPDNHPVRGLCLALRRLQELPSTQRLDFRSPRGVVSNHIGPRTGNAAVRRVRFRQRLQRQRPTHSHRIRQ